MSFMTLSANKDGVANVHPLSLKFQTEPLLLNFTNLSIFIYYIPLLPVILVVEFMMSYPPVIFIVLFPVS